MFMKKDTILIDQLQEDKKNAFGHQGAPWHGGPIRPFGPPEGFFK
jgi:hypothetical protein